MLIARSPRTVTALAALVAAALPLALAPAPARGAVATTLDEAHAQSTAGHKPILIEFWMPG